MIAFYCITVSGLLISMQYRASKKLEEANRPTLRQVEQMLDEENERLDVELASLLNEHRLLCECRGKTGNGEVN